MRRVKDYNSFLKESYLTTHGASKTMTRILDPNLTREIKIKTQSEIEAPLVDSGIAMSDQWEYQEASKGYVGSTPLFGGNVVLREFSEDEKSHLEYEIMTGLNKGKKGPFEWKDSDGSRYPLFSPPYNTPYSDLLGPDEEFLKTYKDEYRWKSIVSEIPGVEIVAKGNKGEFEIHYDDIYQLYGKVRIYYDPETLESPYFSYEVMDGPNSGKKGSSFRILESKDGKSETFKGQGALYSFSGENALPVFITPGKIDYPAIINRDDAYKNKINDRVSQKKQNHTKNFPSTGFNPSQIICLDTSKLTSINPPSKEEFLKSYGELKYSDGQVVDMFTRNQKTGFGGFINKGDYNKTDLWTSGLQGTRTIGSLPIKGNKWPGCFWGSYFYNDMALYSVVCKKTETPNLDFNSEVGCYGNNFFTGRFLIGRDKWAYFKGEWYYDYEQETIGIIYAYDEKGKYLDAMWNPAAVYPDHFSPF